MAILAYVGLPGSGKSYGVVANQIVPALKEGRTVVTNIPLHRDKIAEDIPLSPTQIRELPLDLIASQPELIEEYCRPGDVVVMDELWRLFPAGEKVNKVPEQFKSLLAEHRHRVDEEGRSMQIIFVTQDLAQIGAFARQLVEQTFVHTKLGHMGMSGAFKCEIFHKAVTGVRPPESLKLRTVLGRYEKAVYKYYKSHTMSESGEAGANESLVDGRGNVLKRPILWIAGAFVLIAAPWSVYAVSDFFGKDEAAAGQRASVATARPAPLTRGPIPSLPVPVQRASYRVAMLVDLGGGEAFALLTNDEGDDIYLPASKCQHARMQWRCQHDGTWVTMRRTSKRLDLRDERPSIEEIAQK